MSTVHVAILDDHPSIIDGYLFRLEKSAEITVTATARYGDELEPMLAQHTVDVLLLDISVPLNASDNTPTPILYLIPKLLNQHPNLNILPISMHTERTLIKAVVEAGASGYLFKDDQKSIGNLAAIVKIVASGGIHFTKRAHDLLMRQEKQANLLTNRQLEVLNLLASYPHFSTKDVARELNVADSTVRNLLSDAYLRLGVPNRSAAIIKAHQLNLIAPSPNTWPPTS
ncbi:MAG: response regulator transcription factor [Chloroflexota bacterium]